MVTPTNKTNNLICGRYFIFRVGQCQCPNLLQAMAVHDFDGNFPKLKSASVLNSDSLVVVIFKSACHYGNVSPFLQL